MMVTNFIRKHIANQGNPTSIAPLAMFRVIFGFMMFLSVVRFMSNGWIHELYIKPTFFFSYFGFEWVKPLAPFGMYVLFVLMALAALGIMFGFFYRISATLFFISFTYIELIDKTNYLNHYYFVSIVAFLLILVPANRYLSIDVLLKPSLSVSQVPLCTVNIFKLQLALVYIFAGLAKINYDWLIQAQPLRIWLPANSHLPVIGWLFDYLWIAYAFSWAGMLYDVFVPFFLLNNKTRPWAYLAVIVFHVLTRILFQIGMFPYIMILSTLIFFPAGFHQKILNGVKQLLKNAGLAFKNNETDTRTYQYKNALKPVIYSIIALHFTFQILLPWRFVLYPGKLFWTEQGYRFSWRVMLMEKAGSITFYVLNTDNGKQIEISNSKYLTFLQEKMMATQPDMILQFARHIAEEFKKKGIKNPKVRVESYVALNGNGSKLFIDQSKNLADVTDGFKHKTWILDYE